MTKYVFSAALLLLTSCSTPLSYYPRGEALNHLMETREWAVLTGIYYDMPYRELAEWTASDTRYGYTLDSSSMTNQQGECRIVVNGYPVLCLDFVDGKVAGDRELTLDYGVIMDRRDQRLPTNRGRLFHAAAPDQFAAALREYARTNDFDIGIPRPFTNTSSRAIDPFRLSFVLTPKETSNAQRRGAFVIDAVAASTNEYVVSAPDMRHYVRKDCARNTSNAHFMDETIYPECVLQDALKDGRRDSETVLRQIVELSR